MKLVIYRRLIKEHLAEGIQSPMGMSNNNYNYAKPPCHEMFTLLYTVVPLVMIITLKYCSPVSRVFSMFCFKFDGFCSKIC